MDQMKSAVYMGAQIKTQEVFIHGTTGRNCKFKQFMEIGAKSRKYIKPSFTQVAIGC